MSKLKKYHGTGRVSYRKGVLYEVNRRFADEQPLRERKNNKANRIEIFSMIGGFFSKIGRALSAPVLAKGHTRSRKSHATSADKRFYIIAICSAFAIVVITAVTTTVLLSRARVVINDEGRVSYANISGGETVSELLAKNNIRINEGDAVEIEGDKKLTNGMEIVIHRALPIQICINGKVESVSMLAGTVGETLEKAGVQIGENDEVYPSLDTFIAEGMTVSVIHVDTKIETVLSDIEYKEIRKSSSNYKKGEEYLAQEGIKGTLQQKVKIVYKNGEEFSRTVIDSDVIKSAQDEIVYVGTYEAPTVTPNNPNTSGGKQPIGSSGSDYGQNLPSSEGLLTQLPSISQLHSGTLSQHRSMPAPQEKFIAMTVTAETTAYTWTGNRTATGTYPRIGTVAVDPKLIPYGSILYVPGYGYARAEDTGNFRHTKGETYWLDLYMDSVAECGQWGRKVVKIYILKG